MNPDMPTEEFIHFECQHCGQSIEAPAVMRGKMIECPSCGKKLIIASTPRSDEPARSFGGIPVIPVEDALTGSSLPREKPIHKLEQDEQDEKHGGAKHLRRVGGVWVEVNDELDRLNQRENEARRIHTMARRFEAIAFVCVVIGVILILVFFADETQQFGRVYIAGAAFAFGMWAFLIAQIIYIRAALEK